MLRWVIIFITRNFNRLLLLTGGLFFLVSGALLVATLSSSSVVQVEENLSRYWRTTYDILVRPRGTRSSIEEAYNLVEANFLTGINGGISFSQYEAIRDIPGVAVAAPIAVLAYLPMEVDDTKLAAPASPGVYAYETDLTINRGANTWRRSDQYYVYYGTVSKQAENQHITGLVVNPTGMNLGHQPVPFMLAAIDPEQEAGLVGLDQAVIGGRYLTGYESLSIRETESPHGGVMIQVTGVPVLINRTPYVDFVSTIRIKKLDLPDEADDLEAIVSMGGAKYLDTLPVKSILAEHTTTSSEAYVKLSESLLSGNENIAVFRSLDEYRRPGPRQYEVVNHPFDPQGLALAVDPPAPLEGNSGQNQSIGFSLKAIGSYDIARIPAPTDINRVPLETYFPPITTLKYDENGQPVQPIPVLPTLWPEYSVPSPPFMLTNMEAARVIAGENCISAIRVRVEGIDTLSNEAQQKIEAIGTEIRRRTGLDVDIMVGSSPTRVMVKEPGLGYVEENWIQKGLVFDYRRKVQSGHLILLASIFVIGGIFILDLTWMDVLDNRQLLALQKALGWRGRERITQVIARTLIVGFIATGLGILSGLGLAVVSGSNPPTVMMLVGIGITSMGISFLGSLIPAWGTLDIPPITHIREGREKPRRVTSRVIHSLWRYAWLGLYRHWERTRLGVLAAALSSALLTLFLLVTIEQRGFLAGSLLGQYIAGNIAGYHYAIVGIGFGLTIISLGNSLLAGIFARRSEIGVLKAVGWRTGEVSRLFLGEGLLLGLLGGISGCLIGLLVFLGLYHRINISALWIIPSTILTTALIGIISSFYPSRVAAHIPPSEIMRSE